MRLILFSLIVALVNPLSIQASDDELEEKLKAVMILFEKGRQGLQEEIDSLDLKVAYLEEQNQKLKEELEVERGKNLTLQTQLLINQAEGSISNRGSEDVTTVAVAAIPDFPANSQRGGARQGAKSRNAGGGQELEDAPTLAAVDLVDINSATRDELLSLPLVNEFLADNIINGRPWNSVEDLIQLQGFGPMKLRRLQPMVKAIPIEEISEVEASENPLE
jgi:DNA uptake protein ComE-like DNA-binding protein